MMRTLYLIVLLLLVGCVPLGGGAEAVPTIWPTAILPSGAEVDGLLPTSTAVSLPARITISSQNNLPAELLTAVQTFIQSHPDQYQWVEGGAADIVLTTQGGVPFAQWVYVLAAPFATIEDSVNFVALRDQWQTAVPDTPPLYTTPGEQTVLAELLGTPSANVRVLPESGWVDVLWAERPSRALVPFAELTPQLKVLALNDVSPVARDFNAAVYPLILRVGLVGTETAVNQFINDYDGLTTNRDPAKMTTVAMTGVTALVRATAFNMEQFGILWPGEEVAPILQSADIAHLSNEVSFDANCPYPNPVGGTSFCSSDAYFALIEQLGIDVIELTGNHLNDYGRANVNRSMDMYEAAGMQTFGGGRTLAEAAQPALVAHNGNKIAFVGCNYFGPTYAWATELEGGSRPCDGALPGEIAALNADGHVVIATMQYTEFYHYAPTPQQKLDFQALVDAGAAAVSGSQAHHAQGFDLYNGGFIHYGPGNLFFDQMDQLGTRQAFVDVYTVYDGRLLNVDLWTGLIENYARPRTMTPAEREQALQAVFTASGW